VKVHTIKLRPAELSDAALLLKWRNDSQTRNASHKTAIIDPEEHLAWLTSTINHTARQLFIAEENGIPVGTVRADWLDGIYQLSWTVAANARGRGIGKRIVALLARQISEPIQAEVKLGNTASVRIAESVGMKLEREVDGVLYYQRAALS
jgi:RimJ/RimL family protein N-acetyltransferase